LKNSFQTAVLFLLFNRPDTTSKVFEKIRQIKPQRLYVASDGPRESYDGEIGHTTSYSKNDKEILLKRTSFNKKNCFFTKVTEEWKINRISGIVTLHYKMDDTCGTGTFLFVSNIKAKCEKKDRSF